MVNHNGKTILTAEIEKEFIKIGGANSDKVFRDKELGKALAQSIEAIADAGRFDILERIYETARSFNQNLPRIEDIYIPD